MTRFNISLSDGVKMVKWAMDNARGGEIFVPKLPSYRITDVAEAIGPDCEHRVIGVRPGEKLHEEMITSSDSFNTLDIGHYYVILPTHEIHGDTAGILAAYREDPNARPVAEGFAYNSGDNDWFLSVAEIRELIRTHITPTLGTEDGLN